MLKNLDCEQIYDVTIYLGIQYNIDYCIVHLIRCLILLDLERLLCT